MGNYRFKFSHMIPNAWFYKLKDTGKAMRSSTTKKTTTRITASSSSLAQAKATEPKPRCQPGRASYYFPSRQEKLPSSPVRLGSSDSAFSNTMSMKKTHKKRQTLLAVAECRSTETNSGAARRTEKRLGFTGGDDDYEGIPCAVKPVISEHNKPDKPPISEIDGSESIQAISRSSSCRFTSSATDIILDMSRKNSRSREIQETEDILEAQELVLPPILTKPAKSRVNREKNNSETGSTPLSRERRKSVKLQGRRVRALSPRFSLKTVRHKRFLTESFAVAKSSSDPGRDFRESMMEMIAAKDIRASNDLEDLLACYLSLNSSEYHDIIVKVFEQIWFDLTKLRLRDIS